MSPHLISVRYLSLYLPLWRLLGDISLWLWLAFSWWLVMLSVLSWTVEFFPLEGYLFSSFTIIKIRLLPFLPLSCTSYVFWITTLYWIYAVQILLFGRLPSHFLIPCYTELFHLKQSYLLIFVFDFGIRTI